MQYLVFAQQTNGAWAPQVLDETNNTFSAPSKEFCYSYVYPINEVHYINESYYEDNLIFTRVLFIDWLQGPITLGETQYYKLSEVILYAPSINPPPINLVHYYALNEPYFFHNWLSGCSPEYMYMLDQWQWGWLYEQLIQQQSLAYQQQLYTAINHANKATNAYKKMQNKAYSSEKKLEQVLYKVEALENLLKKPQKANDKHSNAKNKKQEDKKTTAIAKQQYERKHLVLYAIKQFNVLKLVPHNNSKIFSLFEHLDIKPSEQDGVVEELKTNAKECNTFLLAFHKQKINNGVKLCFLKKLATYSDDAHAAYFLEDPNVVPKIIKAINDIKTDLPIKNELLKKYTTLQSEAAKKYDEMVLKPQRLLEKAINELDFATYKALTQDFEILKKQAPTLFFNALKTYSKSSYKNSTFMTDNSFYTALLNFIREFDLDLESILKDPNYCPEIKLATLHKLKNLSQQDFFKLNHKLGILELYQQYCNAANIQDPELKTQLEELQQAFAKFYDLQFTETLAILEGQKPGKIDVNLLPFFANRTNEKQQTILMLAIKFGYSNKTLKPIFEAAKESLFASDSSGMTVLHYLARYYHGSDFSFLSKFNNQNDIILTTENEHKNSYLHYLVRYQKEDSIIKFIEALKDTTVTVFYENANGETITTLLNDKDTEYSKAREVLHDLMLNNFKVFEISTNEFCDYELFLPEPPTNLLDYAKNDPKRLIEIFSAWSKLINNIYTRFYHKKSNKRHIHPGNKYLYQGHTLHWHLTTTLLNPKWQYLESDYIDSYYYKHCQDINVTDTLVFKQLLAIDYSNFEANSKQKHVSEVEITVAKLLSLFQHPSHSTKHVQFVQAVVNEDKLIVPLAILFLMAQTRSPDLFLDIAATISGILFVPENISIVNKFASYLHEAYQENFVVAELAALYLGKDDMRKAGTVIAPNYQALTNLIIQHKSKNAHMQILKSMNEAASKLGGFGLLINEFRKAGCNYLVCFVLNSIEYEADFTNIAWYLVNVTKTDADCQILFSYIASFDIPNKRAHFITKLIYWAACENRVDLLEKIFEKQVFCVGTQFLLSMSNYPKDIKEGMSFLLRIMLRNISCENAADQLIILNDLYTDLAVVGRGFEKLLRLALKENLEGNQYKINEEVGNKIQDLDEIISKTGLPNIMMLNSIASKNTANSNPKPTTTSRKVTPLSYPKN